jgi:hypothetical protein
VIEKREGEREKKEEEKQSSCTITNLWINCNSVCFLGSQYVVNERKEEKRKEEKKNEVK